MRKIKTRTLKRVRNGLVILGFVLTIAGPVFTACTRSMGEISGIMIGAGVVSFIAAALIDRRYQRRIDQ